jgi:biopolymer transport protein ExbB
MLKTNTPATTFCAMLFAAVVFTSTTPVHAQEITPESPTVEAPLSSAGTRAGPVVAPDVTVPAPAAVKDTAPALEVPQPSSSQAETVPVTAPADPAALPTEFGQLSPQGTGGSTAQPPPPKSGALPHDLSPWGMYQAADIVVKAVMIGLVIASFITWTIWAAKSFEISTAKWRLKRATQRILAAPDLGSAVESFARSRSTGATLVRSAAEEVARSLPVLDHVGPEGVKERVTSRLSRVEANAGRRMTLGTGVLATIGATAPFVGLFGTVWGIMNSFIGISHSQTTNLAVVAPGIAEALLATAIGLVAAIPAVIIYNVFARSIAGYRLLLSDASAGVERLVSWELDVRHLPEASGSVSPRAAE